MISGDGITSNSKDSAIVLLETNGPVLSKEEVSFLASVKHWPNVWGECVSAMLLQRSLSRHADALNSAALASKSYAKALVWATWALVFATVALAVIGAIQSFR